MNNLSPKQHAIVRAHEQGYRIKNNQCYNPKGNPIGWLEKNPGPYMKFDFVCAGKRYKIKFHQLLAYQLYNVDSFAKGIVIRHKDDDSLNNHDDNIILGTVRENSYDIPEHLRSQRAVTAGETRKRITDYIRAQISADFYHSKLSTKKIGEKYQLPVRSVQKMLQRDRERGMMRFTFQRNIPINTIFFNATISPTGKIEIDPKTCQPSFIII